MLAISSWGRLSADSHDVRQASDRRQLAQLLAQSKPGLPYGMGRSYGDVCLNANGVLWQTVQLDRFISFDPISGKLLCEAGVLLRDIQRLALPHGWMLPVTPGTQMVTVGGAIANDVHGKNHHVLRACGRVVIARLHVGRNMLAAVMHDEFHAVFLDRGQIRAAHHESDIFTRQRQLHAHIPANGTRANDCYFHVNIFMPYTY